MPLAERNPETFGIAQPLLLTVLQVAALLNVSPRTVSNLLARGELVRRKIGSRTLVPRSSVEAFVRRDHATESQEMKIARRAKNLRDEPSLGESE